MVLQRPEPDAVAQAVHAAHLVPVDASQADVDRAREWERKVREDQRDRDLAVLARYFAPGDWPAVIVAHVDTDPGW